MTLEEITGLLGAKQRRHLERRSEVLMTSGFSKLIEAVQILHDVCRDGYRRAVEAETKRCHKAACDWWPDKEQQWEMAINAGGHATEPYLGEDTIAGIEAAKVGIAAAIARKQDGTDGAEKTNADGAG